jgi:hypothetical protein
MQGPAGHNQDVYRTGRDVSVSAGNSQRFDASGEGTKGMFASLSESTAKYRMSSKEQRPGRAEMFFRSMIHQRGTAIDVAEGANFQHRPGSSRPDVELSHGRDFVEDQDLRSVGNKFGQVVLRAPHAKSSSLHG